VIGSSCEYAITSPLIAFDTDFKGGVKGDSLRSDSLRRAVEGIGVHEALDGRRPMSPGPSLTPREQDILALLTAGKTTREISTELYLSPATVKAHLTSIYRKLGVSNRTEAAIVGLRIFSMLPPASR
jgi:DNA-binding NarL/FixJ family response regulator